MTLRQAIIAYLTERGATSREKALPGSLYFVSNGHICFRLGDTDYPSDMDSRSITLQTVRDSCRDFYIDFLPWLRLQEARRIRQNTTT